jgi:hypothetical protein
MPKGQRRTATNALQNGAKGLREKCKDHDEWLEDHDERIADLETNTGDIETVIVVKNGIMVYGTMRMAIGAIVT